MAVSLRQYFFHLDDLECLPRPTTGPYHFSGRHDLKEIRFEFGDPGFDQFLREQVNLALFVPEVGLAIGGGDLDFVIMGFHILSFHMKDMMKAIAKLS